MALSKIEQKYINQALADLLERALEYKRLSLTPTTSRRDKAIWTALATEMARSYNVALKTLGVVGTSKLAREQKSLIDDLLQRDQYSLFSQVDINYVLHKAYGSSLLERERIRKNLAKRAAIRVEMNTLSLEDVLGKLVEDKKAAKQKEDKSAEILGI
jgi:hypothetical protein